MNEAVEGRARCHIGDGMYRSIFDSPWKLVSAVSSRECSCKGIDPEPRCQSCTVGVCSPASRGARVSVKAVGVVCLVSGVVRVTRHGGKDRVKRKTKVVHFSISCQPPESCTAVIEKYPKVCTTISTHVSRATVSCGLRKDHVRHGRAVPLYFMRVKRNENSRDKARMFYHTLKIYSCKYYAI